MFNLKTKYFPTLKQAKNQQVSKTELEKPERKLTYNHRWASVFFQSTSELFVNTPCRPWCEFVNGQNAHQVYSCKNKHIPTHNKILPRAWSSIKGGDDGVGSLGGREIAAGSAEVNVANISITTVLISCILCTFWFEGAMFLYAVDDAIIDKCILIFLTLFKHFSIKMFLDLTNNKLNNLN